jgi:hypothetical protein
LQDLVGEVGSANAGFSAYSEIASGGDTLHVLDQGRHTVISPSLQVARTGRVPNHVQGAELLEDGRFVVATTVPTRDNIGFPLHLLDIDGSIIRSFGSESPSFRVDNPQFVKFAVTRDGRILLTQMNRYQIERWDTTGTRDITFRRRPPWWVGWGWDQFHPTNSRVVAVREDTEGLLWVAIIVADPDWQPQLQGRAESRTVPISELQKHLFTVVEVIDLDAQVLVATTQIPAVVSSFLGDSLAYGIRENQEGVLVLDVWKTRLLGAHPQP